MVFKKIKTFVTRQTNIDVYQYKHGEIVGTQTVEYFGLLSKIKPFDDFKVEGGVITINNAINTNIKYTIHRNCE